MSDLIQTPVQFQNHPMIEGPLSFLKDRRSEILSTVESRAMSDFSDSAGSLDLILGQALYQERTRLSRNRPNIFTKARAKNDKRLLAQIQTGLLSPGAQVERGVLLRKLIGHYADEIGGNFDPKIYRFATRAVPWGFSWLLNAASVKRFLPWGMTQSLQSRMVIEGEIDHLQKLASQGTILLVPTHQSNIDSILIGYIIYLMNLPPFAYGAGLNLYSNPLLSFFMSRLGAYTVDRQKTNEVYKHVLKNYSTQILKEGIHSIFFPGGGRSRSGAVESHLKLGLLGTGLQAQIENMIAGKPKSKVFVVPMVTSYHFVLEASSLIEDYLADAGKHRFIITDDESFQPTQLLKFFVKLFGSKSKVTIRVGKPLDIFGNFVDEAGESMGPYGRTIDPARWLTTRGELCVSPQRDHEYTKGLGEKLVDRFHKENVILSSHLVAFAFFEKLRTKYPDLDLFRFLRLSLSQRTLAFSDFLPFAENLREVLRKLSANGMLRLSPDWDTEGWVKNGVNQLGLLHEAKVTRMGDGTILTEDMNLLYYYRNRLSGYGISLLALEHGSIATPGKLDAKGFLA